MATRAEEALELCRAADFDVVLTDLELPGISGVELIRRLARRSDPPVVLAMTAHANPRVLARALQAGASQCFLKPFEVESLVVELEAYRTGEAA